MRFALLAATAALTLLPALANAGASSIGGGRNDTPGAPGDGSRWHGTSYTYSQGGVTYGGSVSQGSWGAGGYTDGYGGPR